MLSLVIIVTVDFVTHVESISVIAYIDLILFIINQSYQRVIFLIMVHYNYSASLFTWGELYVIPEFLFLFNTSKEKKVA